MLADRFGAKAVLAIGSLLYALGLYVMSIAGGQAVFVLSAGILISIGLSGTTFPVIFGEISRLVSPENRSLAMGITRQ